MPELERGAYYMTPQNGVVRLRGIGENVVVLREAEGVGRWTVRREPFEQRVATGHIQRVEAQWRPAGEAIEVSA